MDKYTIDEMKYKNGVRDGFQKGLRTADDRNQPKSPYTDSLRDTCACSRCGSGEYLHNEDGNRNSFCGQCGQAIDWTEPENEVRYCPVCGAPSVERYCPNCGTETEADSNA